MGDVLHGGAQLGARMGPEIGDTSTTPQQQQGLTQRVDAAAQQHEQQYQQDPQRQAHPIAAGIGRFGGNVAATSPIMALPGGGASMAGRVGMGMLAGGMGGVTQPVTGGDYWTEKAKQVGIGAGAGGALGAAGSMIGPSLSADVQKARAAFPKLDRVLSGWEGRTPERFGIATVNQALEPINVTVPAGVKAGHGLIEFGQDALTDAYNEVLPHVSLSRRGLPDLLPPEDLVPERAQQFSKMVKSYLTDKFDASGAMDGQAFKKAESTLSSRAMQFKGSKDPDQRQLGEALENVVATMRDGLAAQNPQYAQRLQNINNSYAMFMRVQDAAARNADSKGIFTPYDLLQASKKSDKSSNKRAFASGRAMMQAFGEAGTLAISKGRADPGTANEIMTTLVGETLGMVHGPMGGAAGAVAGRVAGAALEPALQRAGQLASRVTGHPYARVAGRAVSGAAPAAGAAAARTAGQRRARGPHDTEPPP
jgi:hypothetical protein